MKVKVLVTQLCLTLCDPMDCSLPGSLSTGFSRKEYWSGLSFPSPEDLPNPGTEPTSPALQADSLLLSHTRRAPLRVCDVKVTQSCLILCDPMD